MLAMHPGHLVPLLPLLMLLLLLQTASVLSKAATHVYPPDCVPPTGATTPDPGNTTTLVPTYLGLLPIERCCPQVDDCKKNGGFCALNWLLQSVLPTCDFKLEQVCKDYGCSCCVKCSKDKCSKCTEHGGNCRKKCRSDELRDYFKKCTYKKCHCCKKCTANDECTNANGICAANHYDCPPGTYASSGCCGGCYCCKPELQKRPSCEAKTGSYCSLEEECAAGYYACFGECEATQFIHGLESKLVGYCCSPKVPVGGNHAGRMGAFNYYLNQMAGKPISDNQPLLGGKIESEQLYDLAPQPRPDSAQDDVEMFEDEIYDEVVPLEKKGQQYAENDLSESNAQDETDQVDNKEVDADIEIQNYDKVISSTFDSPIQVDSDTDAAMMALDSPMALDIPMSLDSPIDISDQAIDMSLDSPIDISDQAIDISEQDGESKDEVEKRHPHHKRHSHHNKRTENKN